METDMEPILQALVVTLIVATSVVFAAWRLMPARTRLRVLDGFIKPSEGNPVGRWLVRLRKGVVAELTSGGCGSCSQAANHVQKHAAGPKQP